MDTGKEGLVKRLQQESDRRTAMELEAIRLITEGKYKEANNVLKSLDDSTVLDILKEL